MINLNSLSSSEEYANIYDPTEKDEKIILFLVNNNNEPEYPAKIAQMTGISSRWVGERCKKLKEQEILLSKPKHAKSRGYTEHYYLNDFKTVFKKLEYASDDLLLPIMLSNYYRGKIAIIIKNFENDIVSLGHEALTEDEKKALHICLKYSYHCLSNIMC